VKNFNIARYQAYPFDRLICIKKAGVKNIPTTKIEISYNKIERMNGLDDLARIIFPGNRNHQKVFLAIFIELKYTNGQFISVFSPLCEKYGFTPRMLETVRSKMRRMGIIDHVCRFNKAIGYREGWIFSKRFNQSIIALSERMVKFQKNGNSLQEMKDRDLFRYLN
jgi:hypothetical protein